MDFLTWTVLNISIYRFKIKNALGSLTSSAFFLIYPDSRMAITIYPQIPIFFISLVSKKYRLFNVFYLLDKHASKESIVGTAGISFGLNPHCFAASVELLPMQTILEHFAMKSISYETASCAKM